MKKAKHGLTPIEARALELVAEGLESGALAENFNMALWRHDHDRMAFTNEPPSCGTVCCIGGWADTLLNHAGFRLERFNELAEEDDQVHNLLFARWSRKRYWHESDPQKAARAIRHFLRTGKCPTPKQIGA